MTEWSCRNCNAAASTVDDSIPMHPCPGTKGLLTPLVVVGTRVKIQVMEREDYIGKEKVQTDAEGRPVMSIVTTRDDGQDCVVFPATAQAKDKE